MGFFGSIFNAAKKGMEKMYADKFNELRRKPSSLLERQVRAVENDSTKKLLVLAIAYQDVYTAARLASECGFEKNSFSTFITNDDRYLSETATRLMEQM